MMKYSINAVRLSVHEDTSQSYGIDFKDECSSISMNDVSTNRDLVQRIVDDCNKFELDPNQLLDFIEDSLE